MRLPGPSITHEGYAAIRRSVMDALASGETTLDFAEVTKVDSSAVALVLAARRRAPELKVVGAPDDLKALVRLYGLEAIFNEILSEKGAN